MNRYDDIINLNHFEFKKHKRMSIESRSAQFSPFAALTGYSLSLKETERLTQEKKVLSEDMKIEIDMKLNYILEHLNEKKEISIIYFIPDNKKSGGSYNEYIGVVRRIDKVNKKIIFMDKKIILIDDIYDINYE